jgi:Glutathione peroxidase
MTNVASACGYTAGNYKELVALQEKYAGKGLVRSTCPHPGALACRLSLTLLLHRKLSRGLATSSAVRSLALPSKSASSLLTRA